MCLYNFAVNQYETVFPSQFCYHLCHYNSLQIPFAVCISVSQIGAKSFTKNIYVHFNYKTSTLVKIEDRKMCYFFYLSNY